MYENQIVSYPRTEDKEVTPEQFGELLPLVDKIAGVVGVDTSLLSHRTARKTHVKEGGAHGANRPGINVPESLAELEKGYGRIGSAIYSVLAKNYLAMLAEDYEYELVKGYVRDKKKREKPAKPSKPSRAERKAEKKKAKEEAKAAKVQKKAAGRRGATSPNAPSLTGMEKIAVKVSRLQKVTAGLAVIAVLAGGVAVVSEIDANNRIEEAFSGTTEVVAATKTIRAGDEISASDLAFVSVPNSTVADGAITKKDIDDSSKTPVGRVATQYITKGSQLTNASTAGKDNPESLAAAIGDGMEAVTISVDAQSGMGGMLRVNDRVKVIQPNDGSLGGDGFTVIADSVRIAALDGNFSSGSGSSDGYSTVTLEVTPEQAGKIRTAGGLTLTLPSSADTTESGE